MCYLSEVGRADSLIIYFVRLLPSATGRIFYINPSQVPYTFTYHAHFVLSYLHVQLALVYFVVVFVCHIIILLLFLWWFPLVFCFSFYSADNWFPLCILLCHPYSRFKVFFCKFFIFYCFFYRSLSTLLYFIYIIYIF